MSIDRDKPMLNPKIIIKAKVRVRLRKAFLTPRLNQFIADFLIILCVVDSNTQILKACLRFSFYRNAYRKARAFLVFGVNCYLAIKLLLDILLNSC